MSRHAEQEKFGFRPASVAAAQNLNTPSREVSSVAALAAQQAHSFTQGLAR